MQKFYYIIKNDDNHEIISSVYLTSRLTAAIWFSKIKRLKLKEFLKLYSVYEYLGFKLEKYTVINICSKEHRLEKLSSYEFNGKSFIKIFNKDFRLCYSPKIFNNLNKFKQFLEYCKAEGYQINILEY
jgi:hypothetical protein